MISDSSFAPATLTVDLLAVAANYDLLRAKVGSTCVVAGVVKADGYGLGMAEIVRALEPRGCPFYFVATPDEAITLRGQTQKPVAVLGGIYPGVENDFVAHDIIPVLNSAEDLERWRKAAHKHGKKLPAILHFDTGMNRLGLTAPPDEIDTAGLDIKFIMSHFACADEPENPMTAQQAETFRVIAARYPGVKQSIAASAGLFRNDAYHLDMVRAGLSLYGLNPLPGQLNPLNPVVRLDARILQVKTIRPGSPVGYGASYRAGKETTVATVALGYADGFLRSLTNRGTLYYNGQACPVIGRVSMDAVTIDMGAQVPCSGDMVEVIGPHQSADDLAAAAGTIGYEVLTSLGARYHREYTGG
jgi:alanine racemase